MSFEIIFLGGAGTVTGSKYLIKTRSTQVLVDCGLFQGVKSLRLKNWASLETNISDIDAVILTHAHIDHSGYIPRLIKNGFRGKIYSTEATQDLCKILLPDAGYLMEEEAQYLNRHGQTKHHPALPLFTEKEAEASLDFFHAVEFNENFKISDDISFTLYYAGHILGAASVVVNIAGRKIGFSGDLGRKHDEIMYSPATLPAVDYLVVESTYGNRLHSKKSLQDDLEQIVNDAYKRGGVILIPAFAVGRSQSLMYYLWKLREQKKIPVMPMYLNSPMATNVNELLAKHKSLHKLSLDQCAEVCNIVKYVRSPQDSEKLNHQKGPMLIISASGMLGGGRVLHHLKAFGPDENSTIVLTGYQAAGTRGEALEKGIKEVKVHGQYVHIRAQIDNLDNVSAHADYSEIIEWLSQSQMRPQKVFITHGEASAADDLRRRLSEKFGWSCVVPDQGQKYILN